MSTKTRRHHRQGHASNVDLQEGLLRNLLPPGTGPEAIRLIRNMNHIVVGPTAPALTGVCLGLVRARDRRGATLRANWSAWRQPRLLQRRGQGDRHRP